MSTGRTLPCFLPYDPNPRAGIDKIHIKLMKYFLFFNDTIIYQINFNKLIKVVLLVIAS